MQSLVIQYFFYKNFELFSLICKHRKRNRKIYIKIKYLNNFRKVFYRIERQRIKNGKVKIKTEIEELLFKSAIVSIVDMDNFEEKEMKEMKNERKIKLIH